MAEVTMPDAPDLTSSDMATAKAKIRDAWRVLHPDAALPDVLSLSERGITAMTLAEGSYSGLLVALWLDPAQAAQLAIPGGEPAENLHVTLCYVKDFDASDEVAFSRAVAAMADVAALRSEMTGTVGGFGRFFAGESSDGNDVFYATPNIDGIEWLREEARQALSRAYLYCDTDRAYIPHVTLQYLPAKAKTPASPRPIDLTFGAITVATGARMVTIPFHTGTDYVGTYDAPYSYYAEKTKVGPRDAWQFSARVSLAEPDEWIQYLPAPGVYFHSLWGKLDFSADKLSRIVQHFHDGVYQQQLPVDINHESKLSGAVGYITDMRLSNVGAVEVKVNWTERGQLLLDEDRFRYVSAELYDDWQNPVTGDWIQDVAIGMAICTNPHFKTDVLRPLAASELETFSSAGPIRQEKVGMTAAENQTPPAAISLSESQFAELQAKASKADALETSLNEAVIQLNAQGARVEQLETDKLTREFTDLASGRGGTSDGAPWPGGPEKHVTALVAIAKAHGTDSPIFQSYVEGQNLAARSLREAKILTPIGTNRGGAEVKSAYDEIDEQATKLREADPKLTHAQAIDRAFSQAPAALKRQYRDERPSNRSDAD